MRTFDEANPGHGWWNAIKRDLKTLRRIALMVIGYWTQGRAVRQAYRRSEATGETYWVDQDRD